MAKKNQKTECTGMDWGTFLKVVDRLKKDKDYTFLLLVTIGSYCGLRLGDILNLKWNDILDRSDLCLTESKTGKSRQITLNESLQEVIRLCYSQYNSKKVLKAEGLVFANRWGRQLSRQYVNRKLHNILFRYGVRLSNSSSHCLRKTFGRRVYEMNNKSEAALIILSQIFNHSSISTTRRYIGISAEQITNVYVSL